MKFYGTMICSQTVEADRVLRKNGIDIEYVDITASTKNMKEFLKIRDNRKEFDEIKEQGKIGIPAFLLDDGSLTFDVYELEGVKKEESILQDDNFQGCTIF